MAVLFTAPVIGASQITEVISDWVFKTTGRATIKSLSIASRENQYLYTIFTTENTIVILDLRIGAGGYVSNLTLTLGNTSETYRDNVIAIGEYDIKIINRDLAGML
jgi:hypothetical protein